MRDASSIVIVGDSRPGAPVLDVVIPVHNEEAALVRAVETVHRHLCQLPFTFRITIADNASTDDTPDLACLLSARLDHVRALLLNRKGRGHALKRAWSSSDADVLVYMDVDLSTDLNALLPLVAPLLSGHSDAAIGTRLTRSARIVRGPRREVISRTYNALLRGTLRARFSDAQCGFKAVRRDVAAALLPLVEDDAWIFDTELLVLAERAGLRIHEVPVDWIDDPDSRVDIMRTAVDDLRGMARVGSGLLHGRIPLAEVRERVGRTAQVSAAGALHAQIVLFVLVGLCSTLAYALLFLALRSPLGPQQANLAALLATAVLNTATNRRYTFGIRGSRRRLLHHAQGLSVFGAGLAITAGALALLHAWNTAPPPWVEMAVLMIANLAVTVMRFVALRRWMSRSHVGAEPSSGADSLTRVAATR